MVVVAPPAGGQVNGRLQNMYYVYILKSLSDFKYYTGITNNIEIRLRQHNIGYSSTRSTKNRGPFKLIFVQELANRIDAREMEKFL